MNIEELTRRELAGCVVISASGEKLYTPDGCGSYNAHWTRDFTYMAENAGELIPQADMEAGFELIYSHADEATGWIPDRVDGNGHAFYTAGGADFPAKPNLDNGPFLMLLAACCAARAERRGEFVRSHIDGLMRGVFCLPISGCGLLANTSCPPHSPYGFTDTVKKTGFLCMESLLLWRACRAFAPLCAECGESEAASRLCAAADKIERSLPRMFAVKSSGMLLAATGLCRQTDIWTSAFALSISFPLPEEQKTAISRWLCAHLDGITLEGQVRHLPSGEFWEDTFVGVGRGSYQNGAYWATASGWLADALAVTDPSAACRLLEEALGSFERFGAYECISPTKRQLPHYVASAANVYAAVKRHLK